MPIYEYQCEKCGAEFECLILGGDVPECACCHSKSVSRRMSACGFVSKGGGGKTVSRSAGASGCSGCSATGCASCGH